MTEKSKRISVTLIPVLICLAGIMAISVCWLREYRRASYQHVSALCQILITDYPEAETQVLASLKKYHTSSPPETDGGEALAQYGYTDSDFSRGTQEKLLLLATAVFFATACAVFFASGYLHRRSVGRIAGLTGYLEQVNTGSGGTAMRLKEDEFSQLQDELYKTVTNLYQTREAAVKARAGFADNLANIAHQLKTPITAAFLSLQLLEKTTPSVYTDQIEKQLKRLNRLEEALLTLSRIDAGTLHLEHVPVDVYTALNLAAENLSDLLNREAVSVNISDNGRAEFDGDLEWTMEALINLMKNCLEHSPQGGVIDCSYSRNPLYTEILIRDAGPGFDEEDLPHLFERFYRGRRAKGNGIGIGLALARSVFALQNGSITARNRPEGGACFEIRIYGH